MRRERDIHFVIRAVEVLPVPVEAVGVQHYELAAPDDSRARPGFVAALALDLIEVDRKLAIGPHVAADDVGHDLLVREADGVVAVVAVLEAEQDLRVGEVVPAAGFLIELGGDHRGHQDLLSSLRVHLLAHDAFDLLDDLVAQREVVVDTRADAANEPRAQQQLVAGHLGVRRNLS